MNDKDIELLEESFKKFYFDHFNLIHVPQNPNQREFGFQKFNSGMSRHISLKTDKESIKNYSDSCKLYDDIIKNHIIKFKKKNNCNKKLIKRNRFSVNKNKWINFTTYLLMKPLIDF